MPRGIWIVKIQADIAGDLLGWSRSLGYEAGSGSLMINASVDSLLKPDKFSRSTDSTEFINQDDSITVCGRLHRLFEFQPRFAQAILRSITQDLSQRAT
jgi:hypothetical protein